jgi:hypothetical protein
MNEQMKANVVLKGRYLTRRGELKNSLTQDLARFEFFSSL